MKTFIPHVYFSAPEDTVGDLVNQIRRESEIPGTAEPKPEMKDSGKKSIIPKTVVSAAKSELDRVYDLLTSGEDLQMNPDGTLSPASAPKKRAKPAPGSEPQFAVDRVYVDADIQSIFRLAPVLDAIQIDKPVVRVAQTAPGKFDFDDIVARLKNPNPPPDDGKTAHFALYNIELKDGQVVLNGKTDNDIKMAGTARALIANMVTQRVIHIFEPIQIHKHQRQRLIGPLRVVQRGFDPVLQQAAVGQSG